MREKKSHLYVDGEERKLLLYSLVGLKNQLIQQGRYTDCMDNLKNKFVNAVCISALLYELIFQLYKAM